MASYGPGIIETMSRDRTAPDHRIESLPGAFSPPNSKLKKYTEWIVKSYIMGGIKRYEDISSRAWPAIKKYVMLSDKKALSRGTVGQPLTDETNILNYCGLTGCRDKKGKFRPGLDDLLDKYEDILQLAEAAAVKIGDGPVFEGDTIKIYHPKTEEESCHYGRGTKWCTAAREHSMFDDYNEKGPLYIVVPRKPVHKGEKYQLHFETAQFMNERDISVDLVDLFEQYPELRKFVYKSRVSVVGGGIEVLYKKGEDSSKGAIVLADRAYVVGDSEGEGLYLDGDLLFNAEHLYSQYPVLNKFIGPEYRYGKVIYRWGEYLSLARDSAYSDQYVMAPNR